MYSNAKLPPRNDPAFVMLFPEYLYDTVQGHDFEVIRQWVDGRNDDDVTHSQNPALDAVVKLFVGCDDASQVAIVLCIINQLHHALIGMQDNERLACVTEHALLLKERAQLGEEFDLIVFQYQYAYGGSRELLIPALPPIKKPDYLKGLCKWTRRYIQEFSSYPERLHAKAQSELAPLVSGCSESKPYSSEGMKVLQYRQAVFSDSQCPTGVVLETMKNLYQLQGNLAEAEWFLCLLFKRWDDVDFYEDENEAKILVHLLNLFDKALLSAFDATDVFVIATIEKLSRLYIELNRMIDDCPDLVGAFDMASNPIFAVTQSLLRLIRMLIDHEHQNECTALLYKFVALCVDDLQKRYIAVDMPSSVEPEVPEFITALKTLFGRSVGVDKYRDILSGFSVVVDYTDTNVYRRTVESVLVMYVKHNWSTSKASVWNCFRREEEVVFNIIRVLNDNVPDLLVEIVDASLLYHLQVEKKQKPLSDIVDLQQVIFKCTIKMNVNLLPVMVAVAKRNTVLIPYLHRYVTCCEMANTNQVKETVAKGDKDILSYLLDDAFEHIVASILLKAVFQHNPNSQLIETLHCSEQQKKIMRKMKIHLELVEHDEELRARAENPLYYKKANDIYARITDDLGRYDSIRDVFIMIDSPVFIENHLNPVTRVVVTSLIASFLRGEKNQKLALALHSLVDAEAMAEDQVADSHMHEMALYTFLALVIYHDDYFLMDSTVSKEQSMCRLLNQFYQVTDLPTQFMGVFCLAIRAYYNCKMTPNTQMPGWLNKHVMDFYQTNAGSTSALLRFNEKTYQKSSVVLTVDALACVAVIKSLCPLTQHNLDRQSDETVYTQFEKWIPGILDRIQRGAINQISNPLDRMLLIKRIMAFCCDVLCRRLDSVSGSEGEAHDVELLPIDDYVNLIYRSLVLYQSQCVDLAQEASEKDFLLHSLSLIRCVQQITDCVNSVEQYQEAITAWSLCLATMRQQYVSNDEGMHWLKWPWRLVADLHDSAGLSPSYNVLPVHKDYDLDLLSAFLLTSFATLSIDVLEFIFQDISGFKDRMLTPLAQAYPEQFVSLYQAAVAREFSSELMLSFYAAAFETQQHNSLLLTLIKIEQQSAKVYAELTLWLVVYKAHANTEIIEQALDWLETQYLFLLTDKVFDHSVVPGCESVLLTPLSHLLTQCGRLRSKSTLRKSLSLRVSPDCDTSIEAVSDKHFEQLPSVQSKAAYIIDDLVVSTPGNAFSVSFTIENREVLCLVPTFWRDGLVENDKMLFHFSEDDRAFVNKWVQACKIAAGSLSQQFVIARFFEKKLYVSSVEYAPIQFLQTQLALEEEVVGLFDKIELKIIKYKNHILDFFVRIQPFLDMKIPSKGTDVKVNKAITSLNLKVATFRGEKAKVVSNLLDLTLTYCKLRQLKEKLLSENDVETLEVARQNTHLCNLTQRLTEFDGWLSLMPALDIHCIDACELAEKIKRKLYLKLDRQNSEQLTLITQSVDWLCIKALSDTLESQIDNKAPRLVDIINDKTIADYLSDINRQVAVARQEKRAITSGSQSLPDAVDIQDTDATPLPTPEVEAIAQETSRRSPSKKQTSPLPKKIKPSVSGVTKIVDYTEKERELVDFEKALFVKKVTALLDAIENTTYSSSHGITSLFIVMQYLVLTINLCFEESTAYAKKGMTEYLCHIWQFKTQFHTGVNMSMLVKIRTFFLHDPNSYCHPGFINNSEKVHECFLGVKQYAGRIREVIEASLTHKPRSTRSTVIHPDLDLKINNRHTINQRNNLRTDEGKCALMNDFNNVVSCLQNELKQTNAHLLHNIAMGYLCQLIIKADKDNNKTRKAASIHISPKLRRFLMGYSHDTQVRDLPSDAAGAVVAHLRNTPT